MLEDLDGVAWAELTHAYGVADDLPELLRSLAAGDAEALRQLYNSILHQGTVYEATCFVVPFLVEVLAAPAADARGVLGLLEEIAGGTSFMEVHGELLVEFGQDAGKVDRQKEQESAWGAAAREAVAAGIPAYVRLLATAAEETVRAAVVATLTAVGADEESTAALQAAAAADVSPLVRASAVLALAWRGVRDPAHLADSEPLPRVVAAMVAQDTAVLARDAPAALSDAARLPWHIDELLVWIVGGAGLAWPVQVELVTVWLRHPDAAVRAAAAYAAGAPLRAWRPAAAALVPVLSGVLSDPDATVRHWAATQLDDAGRAAAAAADALWALLERDPSCWPALTALAGFEDPRADVLLAGLLTNDADEDSNDDDAATWCPDLDAVVIERRPPSVGPERASAEFYAGLRPSAGDCPDDLIDDLTRFRRWLDRYAIQCIVADLGPWATACRTAIIDAVRRRPPGQGRDRLIRAAVRMQADPAQLVPLVRAQLPERPAASADALGGFGPAAAEALPDLAPLLAHQDPEVRLAAAAAILRVGGQSDGPLAAARAELAITAQGCIQAVAVLALAGPAAAELAPLLRPLFTSPVPTLPPTFTNGRADIAVRAAEAYWHITGDATTAVPALLRFAQPGPRGVQAVRCLGLIGPPAVAAAPTLQDALTSLRRPDHMPDGRMDDRWQAACKAALDRISPAP
ncbi:hypothetical protein AB0K00_53130 [Dactylosporangium sp. NPDC049525]|uniref:hypothetical protein n=1 Tax=Dactylosporangium sp. NPDC049525 TaxID=3154730 RepID=UPI00343D351D